MIQRCFFLFGCSVLLCSCNPSDYALSHKDTTYGIEGVPVRLSDGRSETIDGVTQYFGNEAWADLNGDGTEDVAFLLTQDGNGSGTMYYLVAALSDATGYKGTNAIFLGDRIAPQTTEIRDGTIVANYATRKEGEPMTARPSIGVSKLLTVENDMLVEQ